MMSFNKELCSLTPSFEQNGDSLQPVADTTQICPLLNFGKVQIAADKYNYLLVESSSINLPPKLTRLCPK